MSRKPRVMILRAPGTNCDLETVVAWEKAGADASRVHVRALLRNPSLLGGFEILTIPGGFSYGDDLGAGRVLANELRFALLEPLQEFIAQGKLILGICNGFQVLVKMGLLPGTTSSQELTLTSNDSGKFEERWVYLRGVSSLCVFAEAGETLYLPVAHGEGRVVGRDERALLGLRDAKQIVFQYVDPEGNGATYPWNPNGSVLDAAGICDPTGRVLGLMPHPERHVEGTQHPRWAREGLREAGDGLAVFQRAVHAAAAAGA